MIDHVSIGATDLARSRRFYDAALKALGFTCLSESGDSFGYGRDAAQFWILRVKQPVASNPDSGLHFCFAAPTCKSVDAFHGAAMAAGGKNNGSPGLRKDYGDNYYAAFVTDPDGYRIEAYCGAQ